MLLHPRTVIYRILTEGEIELNDSYNTEGLVFGDDSIQGMPKIKKISNSMTFARVLVRARLRPV